MRPPKLSPEQIAEILTKLAGGATPLALGKEYGVSDQTIYRHQRLAKERAWDIESAGQMRDGGDNVVPIRPTPLLTLPALAKAQEERYQRAVESGVDPLTGALTTPAESDGTICRNVTRELYKAFRAAGREEDYRTQADIAKTIAAVVRARHQIAPPKAARGPLKTYTVEASPESWPPPPKDGSNGATEQRGECEGQAASAAHENRDAAPADDMASELATAGTSSDPDRAGNAATAQV